MKQITNDLCFFRYDDQLVVLPLIPENAELAVGNALFEPLDSTPSTGRPSFPKPSSIILWVTRLSSVE